MSVQTSNRLTDLSARIRQARARAKVASVESAEQYLEAGRLLIEAKEACKHGEWLPFLEMAGVPERQAQRLMQLARSGLKPDTVSDLGGVKAALEHLAEARQPEDDIWKWAEGRLNGPLSDADMEMGSRWFASKLMRLADVPMLANFAITVGDGYNLPMSRLIGFDDLCFAFSIMCSVAKGDREIPFEASLGVKRLLHLAMNTQIAAQRLVALFYDELEYRFEIDEAGYDRDFDDIHTRFMAKAERQLADVDACQRKSREMAKVDGEEVAGSWFVKQCDRIRAECAS
jgi:hypothetical protein